MACYGSPGIYREAEEGRKGTHELKPEGGRAQRRPEGSAPCVISEVKLNLSSSQISEPGDTATKCAAELQPPWDGGGGPSKAMRSMTPGLTAPWLVMLTCNLNRFNLGPV